MFVKSPRGNLIISRGTQVEKHWLRGYKILGREKKIDGRYLYTNVCIFCWLLVTSMPYLIKQLHWVICWNGRLFLEYLEQRTNEVIITSPLDNCCDLLFYFVFFIWIEEFMLFNCYVVVFFTVSNFLYEKIFVGIYSFLYVKACTTTHGVFLCFYRLKMAENICWNCIEIFLQIP